MPTLHGKEKKRKKETKDKKRKKKKKGKMRKKGKYLSVREVKPPSSWKPVRVVGRRERPLRLEAPETMGCADKAELQLT